MTAAKTNVTASELKSACARLENALTDHESAVNKDELAREWRRVERAGEALRVIESKRAGASAKEWAAMLTSRYMVTKGNRIAREMFAA
jgi:hypothetical protein